MTNKYSKPSEITTVGSGNGLELSQYATPFGLVTSDGSGNPPEEVASISSMNYYNKDLDLVQNMRNLFALVSGFKETLDNVILASGYGGWTIMTSYIYPQDRIPGLMYLNATLHYSSSDEVCEDPDGNPIPIWKIRAETVDKQFNADGAAALGQKLGILKFASDADIVYYNNKKSYGMTATNVEDALNELSQRTIILRAELKSRYVPGAWVSVPSESWDTPFDVGRISGENYFYQEVDVPGMLETDYPFVTIDTTNNKSTDVFQSMDNNIVQRELNDAARIARIQTLNGKIRAFCFGEYPPDIRLRLIFRVVRGNKPGEV